MGGLQYSAGAFFATLFSVLLLVLVAQSFGLLVGAVVPVPKTAQVSLHYFYFPHWKAKSEAQDGAKEETQFSFGMTCSLNCDMLHSLFISNSDFYYKQYM